MNVNDYSLRYFTCTGQYIGDFDAIVSIDFGRQKNDVGTCELVLPGIYDLNLFNKDYIMEIWRTNITTGRKELIGSTCWFLRKVQLCREEGQKETLTLNFEDTIGLLKRRFIAWFEVKRGSEDGEFPADYPSAYTDYPDLVLDLIVYHNFMDEGISNTPVLPATAGFPINLHELAGATRRGFPITLEHIGSVTRDDTTHQLTYTFAYDNCLDAMKSVVDTAESTEDRDFWFDVIYHQTDDPEVQTPSIGTFSFDSWWDYKGTDHSWPDSSVPLLFGPDYQNIVNPCLVLDWTNEATQVFATSGSADNNVVGLDGSDGITLSDGVTIPSSASFAEISEANTCPFYPIEALVNDNRSQNNTNTLPGDIPDILDSTSSKAYAELRKRSAVHTLTGDIVQTDGAYLFIDYNYGDRITVDWKSLTFDATVNKFMVSVDNSGESITVPFEGSVRERTKI